VNKLIYLFIFEIPNTAHALLRANDKLKVNNGAPQDLLPRLIVWSGRTEEAVNCIFDYLTERPLDAEFIGLLHGTQNDSYWQNTYRGYAIYKQKELGKNAVCVNRNVIANTKEKNHPIVWIFPGAGSQWATMGKSFLEIPSIRNEIEKYHSLLASKGLNLLEILTLDDPNIFGNILNCFVGVTAITIGIVKVLRELGIEPDYIIGHSFGEIPCAYADGCITAEQAILIAYNRGVALIQSEIIDGAMAAVGLPAAKLASILPKDIDIACYNTHNLCTIAGPAESVKSFVEELKTRKIFAKEVNSSHVPAHSRYIQKAGSQFYSQLCDIVPKSTTRSSKWLSTSVPKSEWKINTQCSARYFSDNLLKPVLFYEASTMLPSNSLTIEIAPHEILQTVLKANLPNGVHVGLARRGNPENTNYFLSALGRYVLIVIICLIG
jgi:fatty acid synthase